MDGLKVTYTPKLGSSNINDDQDRGLMFVPGSQPLVHQYFLLLVMTAIEECSLGQKRLRLLV